MRGAACSAIANCAVAPTIGALVTQYEALFHSAPVLINAFDSDGRCTGTRCERRFGWSIAEINRQDDPLALFYPDPSDRARVRESVDSAPCRAFREWHR